MPFAKNDPNINREGRVKKEYQNTFTKSEIKTKELISLTRRLKPHLSKAVQTAVRIMEDENSTEAGRLKASAMIISVYKDLIKEIYSGEEDGNAAQEVDSSAPVFSLTMVGGNSDKVGGNSEKDKPVDKTEE